MNLTTMADVLGDHPDDSLINDSLYDILLSLYAYHIATEIYHFIAQLSSKIKYQ